MRVCNAPEGDDHGAALTRRRLRATSRRYGRRYAGGRRLSDAEAEGLVCLLIVGALGLLFGVALAALLFG